MPGADDRDVSLADILGSAAFDADHHLIGDPHKHGLLHGHLHTAHVWELDVRVYPPHHEPFETRLRASPRGDLPGAGRRTYVSHPADCDGVGGRCDFALERIHSENAAAAEASLQVAEAFRAAGADADRLVALLPDVPRAPLPTWTPLAPTPTSAVPVGGATPTLVACPNCGAPLELTAEGRCRYCEAPIVLKPTS